MSLLWFPYIVPLFSSAYVSRGPHLEILIFTTLGVLSKAGYFFRASLLLQLLKS